MKAKNLRITIPLVVLVIVGIGFTMNTGVGTLSAIGWSDVSLLCPLGALGTMLASKMMIPRAVISLIVALVLILLFARAFCAWICPVPIVARLRGIFGKGKTENGADTPSTKAVTSDNPSPSVTMLDSIEPSLITGEGKALTSCSSNCTSCTKKRAGIDSRHFVLGGALLSTAVFGFPVFCLICPIGLSFASILLVIRLFSEGDVTWSLIVVPALLLVEVVLFRKWCHRFCPLGAFMSLLGKANRTFRPTINDKACLETSKDTVCGVCAKVCLEGIDPRHPQRGVSWSECTKCRACMDACPGQAITMPFIPPRKKGTTPAHPPSSNSATTDERISTAISSVDT